MSTNCPVCGSALQSANSIPDRAATAYQCPRCGNFSLARTLVITLPSLLSQDDDGPAKLSHALRRVHERGQTFQLDTDTAKAILRHPLPRPREQADLLIRWLAENVPGPGELVSIEFSTHGSIIGSKSPGGFELVLDHLFTSGLVKGNRPKTLARGDRAHATLSFDGWQHYERLRQSSAVYRKAFMAMEFGDLMLNHALEEVFKPSAKQAGFDLFKLDDVPKAGLIDDRLRVEIQASDFVIADLTHDNLGAYWEAGYAEGLGKPVIYTCEKSKFESTKTHFDTNHHLTILWDSSAPESAGADLKATIRATLPNLARLTDEDV